MNALGELRWLPLVLSLEIRRVLTYRVDFWLSLGASLFARAGLAYFVWREIFAHSGAETIAGYDFYGMMLYYVIVALVYEINEMPLQFFSHDIYEGALTRYLVFPLSFFSYKYAICLAKALVHFVQIGLVLAAFLALVGTPAGIDITPLSVALGLSAVLISNYLIFVMTACLDLVGFWADKVWSLGVMLSLTTQFLGGQYFPITAFPEQLRTVVETLPFYYVIAFPVRIFFGELSPSEALAGMLLALTWAGIFTLIARRIWSAGIRRYAAVGQ